MSAHALFSLLRCRYAELLRGVTAISNSRFTAILLYLLYGIEAEGVTYQPVYEAFCRPPSESGAAQSVDDPGTSAGVAAPEPLEAGNYVILHLWSNVGNTSAMLVGRLAHVIVDVGLDLVAFGNHANLPGRRLECVTQVSGVGGKELALRRVKAHQGAGDYRFSLRRGYETLDQLLEAELA